MKVLLVDQIGHKTYEYDYAAAKNYSKDFDVTCYVSDDTPRDVPIEGFKVQYGFHDVYTGTKIQKGLKYIKSLVEMAKFVREGQFDVINLQWYEVPIIDQYFVRKMKRETRGLKVVMTVHGIVPVEINKKKHDGLQKLYQDADAILLHSEPGLKYFNECFQTSCPKYMITSAFRDEGDYVPMDKAEARKKLGIP